MLRKDLREKSERWIDPRRKPRIFQLWWVVLIKPQVRPLFENGLCADG